MKLSNYQRGRLFRFTILTMATGGLLATILGFLGDWHWRADLFSHLRPQYCVWFGLVLIASWVSKYRPALLLAVAGLLINAVALAPYALPPQESEAGTTGRAWTFLSLNLLYGNRDVSRVTDFVRSTQADVVVFQEVSARWAAALEELHDVYPYRSVRSRKDGFGIAVFSREKPVDITIRVVGKREADSAIFGTWESDGHRFHVAGIHPDKPDKESKTLNRRVCFETIEAWCREKEGANEAVVVIGDYNATPWSSSMRSFVRNTSLRNAGQGIIFGATWNVWQPHRLLIDHALFSSHWKLLDHEIGASVGSDHRPLLVRAALRSGQETLRPSLVALEAKRDPTPPTATYLP
jgi:endonuclease/exonuclease/phosphatase (EEP) superfamily protein YafD